MEGERFDAIAITLGGSGSRRASLRALVGAMVTAVLVQSGLTEVAAACKKPGKKCSKKSDCCSKRCKKGRCRCAKVNKPCAGTADCCGSRVCGRNGRCQAPPTCGRTGTCEPRSTCGEGGQACTRASDCCSGDCVAGSCCEEAGTCCQTPTELCNQTTDCCFGGTRCQGPLDGGSKRCCLGEGEFCASWGAEACCNGLHCDGTTGSCVPIGGIHTCNSLGAACSDSDDCCHSLDCCTGQGCCGGVGCLAGNTPNRAKRCCKWPGLPCERNFDCCWGVEFDANHPGDYPDDPVITCEAGAGGRKRCCVREGHHCLGGAAAPGAVCCNGLVCDTDTEKCAKLGIGTLGA